MIGWGLNRLAKTALSEVPNSIPSRWLTTFCNGIRCPLLMCPKTADSVVTYIK